MRQEDKVFETEGAEAKGRSREALPLGTALMMGMFCLILLLALVTGSEVSPELWALFLAYAAGENLLLWRQKKSWLALLLGAAEGFFAVLALVEVGSRMLGIPL